MFVPGLVVRRGLKVSEVAATAQCAVLTEYNETAQRHSEDFVRVASEFQPILLASMHSPRLSLRRWCPSTRRWRRRCRRAF